MPRQAASPTQSSEKVSELRKEIARQRQEILRLRDLLIAKDAELGTAKGRLAEHAEHSMHLLAVAHRVRARIPAHLRQALAGLQRRG
jgi:hypothetical protein